ncbi:MAG: ATP-binding protein [Calditrichia bacterium]
MLSETQRQRLWLAVIVFLVVLISILHYTTSTTRWQYHLIYMQSYFIPILIAAFQFGIKGGVGTSVAISAIYLPHIMLQWGGLIDTNLMRFLQIILFNIVGFIMGLQSQREKEEKKRYQETAHELENSLNLLRSQSEKLEEMEEQLRLADRLAVVGELTASLAHEVRNPLGAIRGAVEILRDEMPSNEHSAEFFQILIDETNRLNAVVENYLSFSRKQQEMKSRVDVREIIRNVRNLLAARGRKEKIVFNLDLGDKPLLIDADPGQIRQILVNLALNAIQAMPSGGAITIQAGICGQPAESGKPETVHSKAYISIRDDGSGIPEGEVENIFKPFYTTKTDGTGLGLAIVKRIVEQNKWRISVESVPGKGTQFKLDIPLA